ncbi:hypothetical protein KGF54_001067 [Candida jiufengensis]|uniref:uncharacterized protein n=1 Tax=Candida jiufengensis TaxID=497108 RepID=UPI002223FE32|nr:uncharacterized protein KGF54_001067 [Candida jiufengensis]KAI5956592.1 hypothetical protein KGF54_001067 [Candida jiufengensis]
MKFGQLATSFLATLSIVKALEYNFKVVVTHNFDDLYFEPEGFLTSIDQETRFKFTENYLLALNENPSSVISDITTQEFLLARSIDAEGLSSWNLVDSDIISFSKSLHICSLGVQSFFSTVLSENCEPFVGEIRRFDLQLNEDPSESVITETETIAPITTEEPIEPITTEVVPIEPVTTEEPIEPVTTEEPIEPVTTEVEPIEQITTEEPIEPVTTEEPVEPVTTEVVPIEPITTEEPIEPITTEVVPIEPITTDEATTTTDEPVEPTGEPIELVDPSQPFSIIAAIDGVFSPLQSNYTHVTVQNLIDGVDGAFVITDGFLFVNGQYVFVGEGGLLFVVDDVEEATAGWSMIDNVINLEETQESVQKKRSEFVKRAEPVVFGLCEAESGFVVYINGGCFEVETSVEQLNDEPGETTAATEEPTATAEEAIIPVESTAESTAEETIIPVESTAESTAEETIIPVESTDEPTAEETIIPVESTAEPTTEETPVPVESTTATAPVQTTEAPLTSQTISYTTQVITITSCDEASVCTEIVETSTYPTTIENNLTTIAKETTITLTVCDEEQVCTESIKVQKTIITTYCPISYTTETIVVPCTTDITFTVEECTSGTDCDVYTTEIQTTSYTTTTITSYLIVTEEGSTQQPQPTTIAGNSSEDQPNVAPTNPVEPEVNPESPTTGPEENTPLVDIEPLPNMGTVTKASYKSIIAIMAILLPVLV